MNSITIYHQEKRPQDFKQMIVDCSKNIHLRSQAEKLLLYYTDQANGFTPTLTCIANKTNIPANKISEVRQRLVDHGLIAFNKEERYIYIAWSRIKAFAMLEEPLRLTRGKCSFCPFNETPKKSKAKTLGELGKKYIIKNPRQLSPEEERFYNVLESMTEDDYILMVESIRQAEFPQYPRSPLVDEVLKRRGMTD